MSDRLEVVITGRDGVSRVFAQVGQQAQTMGQAVQRSGTTGVAGLKQINAAGLALGAALGTLAGTLSNFARGSEAAAQVHRQLEQAIQNTGASFDQYASRIEAAGAAAVQLGIDDEKAFQALQSLTENTGSAETALQNLGLAEDLSAAKGIDLVSAANLIGKVYNGNVGILARYGIAVTQGSTATQALAQVQAQVAGQAGAHANSLARWHEELSNVADAIGGALGSAAPFVAMLPGLTAGVTLAGTAIGGLSGLLKVGQGVAESAAAGNQVLAASTAGMAAAETAAAAGGAELAASQTAVAASSAELAAAEQIAAAGALEETAANQALAASALEVAAAQKSSTGVMGGLAAMAGPLALVAVGGAAVYGAFKLWSALTPDIGAANAHLTETTEKLATAIDKLVAAGDPMGLRVKAWSDELATAGAPIGTLQSKIVELETVINQNQDNILDVNVDIASQAQAVTDAAQKELDVLHQFADAFGGDTAAVEEYAQAQHALISISQDTGVGAQKMMKDFEAARATFEASGKTAQDTKTYFDALISIESRIPEYDAYVTAMTQSSKDNATALGLQADALGDLGNAFGALKPKLTDTATGQKLLADIQTVAAYGSVEQKKVLSDLYAQYVETGTGLDVLLGKSKSYAGEIALTDAFKAQDDEFHKINQEMIDFIGQGDNIIGFMRSMRKEMPGNQGAAVMGGNLATAREAIDTTFRVIAQGTNALGQSSQAVNDWSQGLATAGDGMSKLDQSLADGNINQTQYNRAVMASNSILRNNAAAQADVVEMQAKQLPFLAEQEQAYRRVLDTIADMPVTQQRVALAFADSGEQASIASAYSTAYAASLGEIPPEVASQIILSNAQADPILLDVLKKYGLVKEGADGTLSVDFPNAETIQSAIDTLSRSISDLTNAIWQVQIDSQDNASGVIGTVEGELAALNGRRAVTYIDTVSNTIPVKSPFGLHGGVMGYSAGGIVAEMGEAGREMLSFAGGGVAFAERHGLYNVPRGTYVTPAPMTAVTPAGGPSFQFHFHGDINGFPDLDTFFAAAEQAARSHFKGMGA